LPAAALALAVVRGFAEVVFAAVVAFGFADVALADAVAFGFAEDALEAAAAFGLAEDALEAAAAFGFAEEALEAAAAFGVARDRAADRGVAAAVEAGLPAAPAPWASAPARRELLRPGRVAGRLPITFSVGAWS
jgi:hypothetical protein